MHRLSKNIFHTKLNLKDGLNFDYQQIRSLRLRKPPWVPRSKNKQFKIPNKQNQNLNEYMYLSPIWNAYKAEMRSIYQLFRTEDKFTDQASVKVKEEKRILQEKEAQLFSINDKKNKEILKMQLIEENEKLIEKKRLAELELEKKNKIEELYLNKANHQIIKLKEKSKNFINPINLEKEIEKALNEIHNHNFSIDTSGRFFKNQTIVTKLQAFNSKFLPDLKKDKLSDNSIDASFISN